MKKIKFKSEDNKEKKKLKKIMIIKPINRLKEKMIFINKMIPKNRSKKRNEFFKIFFIFFLAIIYIRFYNTNTKENHEKILDYPKFSINIYDNIFNLLNEHKTLNIFRREKKIDNIFILIIIFPFLKKEVKLTEINPIYNLCKNIFNIKNQRIITLKKEYIKYFSYKFKEVLYNKWDGLPSVNKTNYLRHILTHYYNNSCLKIYEKSLNLNMKYYIESNNINSLQLINDLMSKILLL